MKWLLYALAGIGGLFLLCIVVLLIIAKDQSTLRATIDIAKPAPVVFSYVTEPARVKTWLSWLVEIQNKTPDTTGVGAKHVWVMEDRNNNNQLMNINVETTKFEPNRLLEVNVSAAEGFTGVITYQIEQLDANRSRLSYTGNYKFNHWLAKFLEPLITRSAQQKLNEDIARMKQHAEAS